MSEQDFRKLVNEISNTKQLLRHRRIDLMSAKIHLLLFYSLFDCYSILDILLWSVFDTNKTQSQAYIFSFNHPFSTGSFVHNINLGNNTDGPNTLWVKLTSHLQSIRSRHVLVSWEHTKNNGPALTAISSSHCFRNSLDIFWLIWVSHGNSCNTWKIDHGQIWTRVRIDMKYNWIVDDIFTRTTNFVCKEVYCLFYFGKIREFLVWNLVKFGPCCLTFWGMVQTKLKWTSCNDTITSRQKIKSHDGFNDRWFSCRLGTKHANSWQLNELLKTNIS